MISNPPPPLTRRQVREIDRRAIEQFGIPPIILMENAGRGAAHVILGLLRGPASQQVAVVCGGGNNGGDGYVIARHLANAGVPVEVFSAVDPSRLTGDAATNHLVVSKMGLSVRLLFDSSQRSEHLPALRRAGIVVDALLGTGATGDPRPPFDEIIRAINDLPTAARVAVDIPSGLDCDTGRPGNPTVRASLTVTFVAPKAGFSAPQAAPFVGKVVVVDIGVPRSLLAG